MTTENTEAPLNAQTEIRAILDGIKEMNALKDLKDNKDKMNLAIAALGMITRMAKFCAALDAKTVQITAADLSILTQEEAEDAFLALINSTCDKLKMETKV